MSKIENHKHKKITMKMMAMATIVQNCDVMVNKTNLNFYKIYEH